MHIGKSKQDMRKLHWQEIAKRVTTHEGELIKGAEGQKYKEKYSNQYLGKDLSKPLDFNRADYQKELAKTK